MENHIKKAAEELMKYPNVRGYSKVLMKRERDGKIVEEWVLQVHVSQKIPEKELRKTDIIPKEILGIPIDVVQRGPYKALLKKTDKVRPLVGGISIGNIAITVGTHGFYAQNSAGEILLKSNAHVLTNDPSNKTSTITGILQPGRSPDGGVEIVAEYLYHKQLFPMGGQSDCPISNFVVIVLNALSQILKRKTRFSTILQETNHIDFAVARLIADYKLEFFDIAFPPDKFKYVGLGFAGSDNSSLIHKQQYEVAEGYKCPLYQGVEVQIGDTVHKTGRTSCYSTATVLTPSVVEIVSYGSYEVLFDDVIMTTPFLEPGDSGSAVFKEVI